MSGTAWVTFESIHPYVSNSIKAYVKDRSERDTIETHTDGSMTWTRPPNGNGSGVKKHSQESDFYRMVAQSVLNFSVGSVEKDGKWPIKYREVGRQLVDVIDSGWDEEKTEE